LALFAVIYDACVLYPAPLRDILIELAAARLFRAQWSEQIHDEWIRNLAKNRPDLERSRLERAKQLMNDAIMDCCVTGYGRLVETITLPDPNDRHVVAAAMHAKSNAIVTFNLKDFPEDVLAPLNLEAIHPDDFITYQLDLNEAAVLSAASKVCRRLRNPAMTGGQYLDALLSCGLPKTVTALRPYEEVIFPTSTALQAAVLRQKALSNKLEK
jgi:predicted nucleic acid-binding protein